MLMQLHFFFVGAFLISSAFAYTLRLASSMYIEVPGDEFPKFSGDFQQIQHYQKVNTGLGNKMQILNLQFKRCLAIANSQHAIEAIQSAMPQITSIECELPAVKTKIVLFFLFFFFFF